MAAIAKKKYEGQSGDRKTGNGDQQSEPYVVTGASSPADAVAAALAAASAASEDTITDVDTGVELVQVGVGFQFIAEQTVGGVTTQTYEVTIRYGAVSYQPLDVGHVRVNYDTSGGTVHTTLAKTETVYPSAGTNTASFHLVIGNQEDSADGCDIPVSDFHLSVTVVFNGRAAIGTANAMPAPGDVFAITGKTNAAAFSVKDTLKNRTYSFLAGEMICEGASEPDPRPDGNVEMTFRFHCSPNVTNQTIGTITGIDKKGSEYLWVRYETQKNAVQKMTTLTPKYVIVNQVMYTADFSLLCIPVPP